MAYVFDLGNPATNANPFPEFARLRAEGRITPAKAKPAPWPATKARYTPAQVNALFAESRGDR